MSSPKSIMMIIVLLLIVHLSNASQNLSTKNFLKKITNKGTCNQGFGKAGKCYNSASILSSISFPGDAGTMLNNLVLPALTSVTSGAEFCLGDYSGTDVTSEKGNLAHFGCSNFPFDTSYTYGVISATASNVPCGSLQTVSMCASFDDCGTFALSINGGVAACAATYSTGIAAIVSPLAGILDSIALGFSPNRKFTETFTVAYPNGNSVNSKSVTTKGHFFIGINLTLPIDFLTINGKSLGDYFQLNVNSLFMIDFGTSTSIVTSLISSIKNANKTTGKALMNSILKQGAEITAYVSGTLTILLDDMTKGLLNNFNLNIGTATVLITQGGSGSNSGLGAGVYMYFDSSIVSNMISTFNTVYDHFGSILKEIGFSKPSLPSGGVSLGIFIASGSAGFQFNFSAITVKCIFNMTNSKGSCGFLDKYFTAIANAGKWVIKKASAIFDEAGDEIVNFAQGVGSFATNSAQAVAAKTTQLANQAASTATKAANTVANTATNTANTVANTATSATKTVVSAFKKW